MDDRRFDSLTKTLANAKNRRSVLKGLLGLGSAALTGSTLFGKETDAARRPTPTPKQPTCPGRQTRQGGVCVCPGDAAHKCGPDCCTGQTTDPYPRPPDHTECCDNACCDGTCYGEELCCPTNLRPGELPPTHILCEGRYGLVCIEGTCCDDSDCGDPCQICNQQTHTCEARCDSEIEVCCTEQAGPGVCVTGECCPGTPCGDEQTCCLANDGEHAICCATVGACGDDGKCPAPAQTCEEQCLYRCGDLNTGCECGNCPLTPAGGPQFCTDAGWCCPGTSLGTNDNCRWCGDACLDSTTCQFDTNSGGYACAAPPDPCVETCLNACGTVNGCNCGDCGEGSFCMDPGNYCCAGTGLGTDDNCDDCGNACTGGKQCVADPNGLNGYKCCLALNNGCDDGFDCCSGMCIGGVCVDSCTPRTCADVPAGTCPSTFDDGCGLTLDCSGSCSSVPNGTAGCVGGVCKIVSCNAGYADCDGIPANGCEANVLNSSQNCGTCGSVCASGRSCENGQCILDVCVEIGNACIYDPDCCHGSCQNSICTCNMSPGSCVDNYDCCAPNYYCYNSQCTYQ